MFSIFNVIIVFKVLKGGSVMSPLPPVKDVDVSFEQLIVLFLFLA